MKFIQVFRNQKLKNTKGSATLYSLFVAMVILTLAIGFNWIVREHLKASFFLSQKMQALVLAYSNYQLLLFSMLPGKILNKEVELFEGGKYLGVKRIPLNGKEITLNENLIQRENSTLNFPVSVSLKDTNGLISLITFRENVFNHLLKYLGVEEERRRVIVDSFLDWIDQDNFIRLNGAERDFYKKEGKPYFSRNYEIQYKEELAFIRGMDFEIYKKLEPFITILPNSGFNPNTAQKEIIRAYLDLEDERALDNLLLFLSNETLLTNYQLFSLTGKALALDEGVYFYPSLIFELTLKVGYPEPLYTIKAGLDLRLKTNTPFEILYWKEN